MGNRFIPHDTNTRCTEDISCGPFNVEAYPFIFILILRKEMFRNIKYPDSFS